jgi:predicted lipoprotein
MRTALIISVLAVALTACASAAQDEEYNQLVTRAENEIKLAGAAGFLWRDTEQFLKESKEAHAAGDRDLAFRLARQALKQAQLAQQQARDNANAGPGFGQ